MKMVLVTLSKFSLLLLSIFLSVNVNVNVVEASHEVSPELESVSAVNAQLVHRTGYHFQPVKHWINGTEIYIFT